MGVAKQLRVPPRYQKGRAEEIPALIPLVPGLRRSSLPRASSQGFPSSASSFLPEWLFQSPYVGLIEENLPWAGQLPWVLLSPSFFPTSVHPLPVKMPFPNTGLPGEGAKAISFQQL